MAATTETLRQHPMEWHRRGMLSPDEVDALVQARLAAVPGLTGEPSYGDFFRAS